MFDLELMMGVRWDETKVPPFRGEHCWVITVVLGISDEMLAATDRREPIRTGPLDEALRVSPVFCAYCGQSPNSAPLGRSQCGGPSNG